MCVFRRNYRCRFSLENILAVPTFRKSWNKTRIFREFDARIFRQIKGLRRGELVDSINIDVTAGFSSHTLAGKPAQFGIGLIPWMPNYHVANARFCRKLSLQILIGKYISCPRIGSRRLTFAFSRPVVGRGATRPLASVSVTGEWRRVDWRYRRRQGTMGS